MSCQGNRVPNRVTGQQQGPACCCALKTASISIVLHGLSWVDPFSASKCFFHIFSARHALYYDPVVIMDCFDSFVKCALTVVPIVTPLSGFDNIVRVVHWWVITHFIVHSAAILLLIEHRSSGFCDILLRREKRHQIGLAATLYGVAAENHRNSFPFLFLLKVIPLKWKSGSLHCTVSCEIANCVTRHRCLLESYLF